MISTWFLGTLRRRRQTSDWRHARPARTAGGWRTPVQGDKGAPDLLLARGGQVILAELKRDGKNPTADQVAWLNAIGATARLWRPADWMDVLAELKEAQ